MKPNKASDLFLEILQKRYPDKKDLANHLVEFLNIEKEAIYRRLRGTVPFSFSEVCQIALHFDISLDDIITLSAHTPKTRPLRLTISELWAPKEQDYLLWDRFINDMKQLSEYPESEHISISNTIPQSIYLKYEHIYKFYLFKWHYEEGSDYTKTPYSEIKIEERLKEINRKFNKCSTEAKNTILIWDKNTLQMLQEDIRYFYDIRLISKDEIQLIHKELMDMLDELETVTAKGQYPNGNNVQLYISNSSLKGTYTVWSINPNYKVCMLKFFHINDTTATDEVVYEKMKNWTLSLQRTSTLISESGEIQRIRFFNQQKEIISSLITI